MKNANSSKKVDVKGYAYINANYRWIMTIYCTIFHIGLCKIRIKMSENWKKIILDSDFFFRHVLIPFVKRRPNNFSKGNLDFLSLWFQTSTHRWLFRILLLFLVIFWNFQVFLKNKKSDIYQSDFFWLFSSFTNHYYFVD